MRVIRADALGMCFGVKDALTLTEQVDRPEHVTIHGELVHNPIVQLRLSSRGFQQSAESERGRVDLETPAVLITAHGVSDHQRVRFLQAGVELIDTTCPLVRRAHRAAIALERQGYYVIVLGKHGHVEVEGLTGDLAQAEVVATVDDVRTYHAARLGIVSQTTMQPEQADALCREIERRNPQAESVRYVDTICRPTKERQRALERLIERVDGVVVVGGRNSNNTRALFERCRQAGVLAWHVESAEDLDAAWFAGVETVGLTAGTSTLDETIDAVQSWLETCNAPLGTLEPAVAIAGVGATDGD